ncbi:MAG TPA: hypothetical protein VHT91_47760 [Kofleriaceae bacterium]|nr:hypothetical protein [Kofleriaceae bacterium]
MTNKEGRCLMPRSRFDVLVSFCSLSSRPVPGVARCLAIVVLAVVGASVSASSAHAASSTTCTGSSAISYSPGLTNTPRTVTYSETETYSSCTSTDTSLTAGSTAGNFTFSGASCNGGGIIPPSSYTISWNNSQSSTMTLTYTDVIIGGTEQVTGVGTVTSGEFTGGAVTIVWLYPVLNPLLCLTSQGVTSQSGTVLLEILVAP